MPTIEALYIFDETSTLLLSHTWSGRPPSPSTILPLYLSHPAPRPSLLYESTTSPPTLIHSLTQDRLLFLALTSSDCDPLIPLEFLHRLADAFTDILGAPLLPQKITASYPVLAQLLPETCDAGHISVTEPNPLHDILDSSTWLKSLLGLPLPSSTPTLSGHSSKDIPSIPWRRSNVKHTSNEMYVDILESLHVISSPSGLPLSAYAHGSVLFNSKISGVPDILLSLTSAAGGQSGLAKRLELPVFHPCVRLARWNARPGEVSFVPPDGRCVLAGYEVDLLGSSYIDELAGSEKRSKRKSAAQLSLPATVSIRKDTEKRSFTINLHINNSFAPSGGAPRGDAFAKAPGLSGSKITGTSAHPVVEDICVRVPIPPGVRSLGDLKPNRGEVRWAPGMDTLEWRVDRIDGMSGHGVGNEVAARLRCDVQGDVMPVGEDGGETLRTGWEYDEEDGEKQSKVKPSKTTSKSEDVDTLMPSSASVSFQVRGWLASGVKVDKLVIDAQRSRGIGAGVQPYKGVKYVTVSQNGVETRC